MSMNQMEAEIARILTIARKIPLEQQRETIGYALANLLQHENESSHTPGSFDMQEFIDAAELPQ